MRRNLRLTPPNLCLLREALGETNFLHTPGFLLKPTIETRYQKSPLSRNFCPTRRKTRTGWSNVDRGPQKVSRKLWQAFPRGGPPELLLHTKLRYSTHVRECLGVVVADTETRINHICGGEVPPEIVDSVRAHRSDLQTQINQCELLVLVSAVMTFPEPFLGFLWQTS